MVGRLQHQDPAAGAGEVGRGGEPVVPGTDDDVVVVHAATLGPADALPSAGTRAGPRESPGAPPVVRAVRDYLVKRTFSSMSCARLLVCATVMLVPEPATWTEAHGLSAVQ